LFTVAEEVEIPYTPDPPLETRSCDEVRLEVVARPVYVMVELEPPRRLPSVPLTVNGPETARVEVAAVFSTPLLPYMTPESEPRTGALVNLLSVPPKVLESVRRVVDAAEVTFAESVAPSNVRPEPMRRVFTPAAPFPAKMPESVVEPVPPYTPLSVVVALTTPLIAWSGPVSEPMVSPPLKVLRAL
jgi:hypothetical protein